MYCSSCGADSTRGLSHCRVCGANFNPPAGAKIDADDGAPAKVPGAFIGLFIVTALVGAFGFAGLFTSIINFRRMGLTPENIGQALALIMVFGTISIVGVVTVLSFLLWRVFGVAAKSAAPSQSRKARQTEHPPLQVAAPPPVMRSVTEHTTRNFEEPLYREPGARE